MGKSFNCRIVSTGKIAKKFDPVLTVSDDINLHSVACKNTDRANIYYLIFPLFQNLLSFH